MLAKIQILEVFNNQNFFEFDIAPKDSNNDDGIDGAEVLIKSGNTSRNFSHSTQNTGLLSSEIYVDETYFSLCEQQMQFIEQTYRV